MEGLLILVFVGIAIAVLVNASQEPAGNPIYLDVPFPAKDEAKRLGAKWNADRKKWYVPAGKDPAPFAKWMPVPDDPADMIFLEVPFEQNERVKKLGARWNAEKKRWYITKAISSAAFAPWFPSTGVAGKPQNPRGFKDAIAESINIVLDAVDKELAARNLLWKQGNTKGVTERHGECGRTLQSYCAEGDKILFEEGWGDDEEDGPANGRFLFHLSTEECTYFFDVVGLAGHGACGG